MTTFNVHAMETASAPSKTLLEKSQKEWGFIPTLRGILAESAPVPEEHRGAPRCPRCE
jgi:hypothetical protein